MSSNEKTDRLDLKNGPPTTEKDVETLRKLRDLPMTDAEYSRLLASVPPPSYEELAAKRGPRGEPFRLR